MARRLRDRLVEGRLSPDTFSRRLEEVYGAKDRQQLQHVVRDFPPHPWIARLLGNVVELASELVRIIEVAWRRPRVAQLALPTEQSVVSIGRAAGSGYRITDSSVSREHASLYRVGDAWLIKDLGSLNGTRLNGVRVLGPTSVSHGDIITLGREHVRVT